MPVEFSSIDKPAISNLKSEIDLTHNFLSANPRLTEA
jgi:hypothetical protein